MKSPAALHGPLWEPLRNSGPRRPQTVFYLNRRYFNFQRELAFPQTRNLQAWKIWRRRLRAALWKTLCLDQLGKIQTPQPQILETKDCKDYCRQKIAYETLRGNWVTAYLLTPYPDGKRSANGAQRRPAVICPHGHVKGGKEAVVKPLPPYGSAYGHELARRGLVVLAPDNAGMGERDVAPKDRILKPSGACQLAWARLNHMGLDLTGLRVFDLMAGVNLLRARADVDGRRIGAAGLSHGCWLSQLLAALDRRVRAVVLSGFFTTFRQTVWHGHCVCHHPRGIGLLCDMPDISALIAPRPQFIESGRQDRYYPLEPAWSQVRRAYELLEVPERLGLDHYRGGHMFHGTKSIPWLVERLRGSRLPSRAI